MIGTEKVFFDTSPFIYIVENHPQFAIPVRDFMADQILLFESQFFTSSLSLAEFFVKPKKLNDLALIEKFKNKLKEYHFIVFDITPDIAEYSSELRAKYSFLKAFDQFSWQLQSALGVQFSLPTTAGLPQ